MFAPEFGKISRATLEVSGKMRLGMLFPWLILSLGISVTTAAQDKKQGVDEILRVDTQLIDVPLSVTTPAGAAVRNLKQSNFVIYEDGKPQEIANFAAAAAPFEVALLLDTSGSTRGQLELIQRAANEFIASLRLGDRVAIVAFKTDRQNQTAVAASDVVTKLTDDRKLLRSAIEHVTTSNGTPYYDSLLQVAEKVFSDKPQEEFRDAELLWR